MGSVKMLDDLVETQSPARELRGRTGSEYPALCRFRSIAHGSAGSVDLQENVTARPERLGSEVCPDLLGCQFPATRSDIYCARVSGANRFAGVDDQVHDELLYLPGICQNFGQIRRQIKPHIHSFRNRSLDERQNVANQLREVDALGDELSEARLQGKASAA